MLTQSERIYGLSILWKEAAYNFPFWDLLPGLDWDEEYQKSLEAVQRAPSLLEYYLELMRFLSLLQDGHTYISLPAACYAETPLFPIKLAYLGGEHVLLGKDAACDIPLLSPVLAIDGVPTDQYLEQALFPYCWHGKPDSALASLYSFAPLSKRGYPTGAYALLPFVSDRPQVTLTTPSGAYTLSRRLDPPDWVEVPRPQPDLSGSQNLHHAPTLQIDLTGDGIALVRIPTFLDDAMPQAFFRALPRLLDCAGFLFDLRDNPGGHSDNADAISQPFLPCPFPTGRVQHLLHNGAYWAWGKEFDFAGADLSDPYTQMMHRVRTKTLFEESVETAGDPSCPYRLNPPVVILSNAGTASSGENFLMNFALSGRATLVGAASYGSTGNALRGVLPGGGRYQICTRRYTDLNGVELTNRGVRPQVDVENSPADYESGFDRVFQTGLDVLRKTIKEKSGC